MRLRLPQQSSPVSNNFRLLLVNTFLSHASCAYNCAAGPMRLLFPRQPGGVGEAADFQFSLLGLGDVAIPGLLACLVGTYGSVLLCRVRKLCWWQCGLMAMGLLLSSNPGLHGRTGAV